MFNLRRLISGALATSVVLLSGCSVISTVEMAEQQEKVSHKITQTALSKDYTKVLTLERPPVQLQKLEVDDRPEWLDRDVKLVVDGLPLNLVLRDLLGKDIKLEFGYGVDPVRPVSVWLEGTVEEALNILSVSVDYGLLPTETGLSVSMQETKTFFIPAVSGDVSYQIGSNGQGGSSSGVLEGQISSTGAGDGQYSRLSAEDYNSIEHIRMGVESLLRGVDHEGEEISLGYVREVPLMSSLVVKTSPRVMVEVEKFIEQSVQELSREVELEIQVVEYLADDNTQIGANLNAILTSGGNTYGLDLLAPTLGGEVTTGASFNIGEGKFTDTAGLLTYLSTQGKVTVKTLQKVKASNYQMQEVDLSEVTSYISELETTQSDDASQPTVSIKKALVRDGVKMLVLPTVKKDSVYLRLTGTLSKLLGFDVTEIGGVQVKDARVRQARFNTSGRYEYNNAILVTHMRQEVTSTEDSSTAEVTNGVSGRKEIVDTLVLVTPRRPISVN